MSYDELPQEESARPAEGAAPSSEAEAFVADAPSPSAPRQPRRPRRTGTAAASAPESPAEPVVQPARAPRTRRKTSQPETSDVPAAASESADAPVAAASAKETPAAKPQTARRSRKTATPDVTAETPAAPTEVEAPVSTTETSAPVPAKRPSRTKQADTAPATKAEAVDETVPTETPVSTPEAQAKPAKRGRTPRKRAPEPAAETPAETPSIEATPVSQIMEVEAKPAVEPASKRRRTRRTKPTAPTEPVAPTPEEIPVATQEVLTTEIDAEAESESEESSDARQKRRRNRRGGRSRGKRDLQRTEVEVQTDAIAETVGEATVAPEPEEEPVDTSVGTHLLLRNGVPQIHINGKPYAPVFFFGNMENDAARTKVLSELRKAAQSGVHLHSTLVDLPCPLTEASHALDEIDNRLKAILDADPEGFVMPRVLFYPAKGWKREYPTEFAAYADGTTGDPSFTSERFWQEAERSMEMLISHLQGQEWGRRVFGYHLERGEWFQPADLGYDRSTANRDAFRDWLREKYRDDLVKLRGAWHNGDVQFHTADIPAVISKPNPQRAFFEMRRERNTVDFQEFTSETTARRLIRLARVVKKATNRQALVSACYGYTLEFGHGFSGHLALAQVLASSAIDLLSGPPSYRDRKPGGAASLPAPVDSFALHGKLWLSEDDTKTYLAPANSDPEDFNPRLSDRFLTEQAQTRAMGKAFANRSGIGFMDLWGEGWLDDDGLWNRIETFAQRYERDLNRAETPQTPDVIALMDERSLLHIQRGEPFFRKLTADVRNTLQRAGISYALHLQTDVLAENFPTDAKLYLFLTPFRLPADVRTAIKEKLQNGGKTLAFLYAPGTCDALPFAGGTMEEGAVSAVGITLRPQEWNAEIGSRVTEQSHPLTQSLLVRELGTRERLNPSFYVDDEDATTVAEYIGSGAASVAVKNCGSWKSVFLGEPTLPIELLRGVCRYAGVPVWTQRGDDVTEIGNGMITLHAARDGQRTLNLPHGVSLYDLTDDKLVVENGRDYRWFQRGGTTRQFRYGTRQQLESAGLTNLTLPERRRNWDESRERRSSAPPSQEAAEQEPANDAEEIETEAVAEAVSEISFGETEAIPAAILETAAIALPETAIVPDDARREDLKTLEAVLSMNLSDLGDDDLLPPMDDDEDEGTPADLVTAGANVSSALEGLLETDISGANKRRRRRGGRGRGKRRGDEEGGADGTDGDAASEMNAPFDAADGD